MIYHISLLRQSVKSLFSKIFHFLENIKVLGVLISLHVVISNLLLHIVYYI